MSIVYRKVRKRKPPFHRGLSLAVDGRWDALDCLSELADLAAAAGDWTQWRRVAAQIEVERDLLRSLHRFVPVGRAPWS